MPFKYLVDIFIQRYFSLCLQKSDCHSGNTFAHGIRDMPDSALIRRKIAFTDLLSMTEDHQMMHIRQLAVCQLPDHFCQILAGDPLTLRSRFLKAGSAKGRRYHCLLRNKIRPTQMPGRSVHQLPYHFYRIQLLSRCHTLPPRIISL